jgi:hypothetical protein
MPQASCADLSYSLLAALDGAAQLVHARIHPRLPASGLLGGGVLCTGQHQQMTAGDGRLLVHGAGRTARASRTQTARHRSAGLERRRRCHAAPRTRCRATPATGGPALSPSAPCLFTRQLYECGATRRTTSQLARELTVLLLPLRRFMEDLNRCGAPPGDLFTVTCARELTAHAHTTCPPCRHGSPTALRAVVLPLLSVC